MNRWERIAAWALGLVLVWAVLSLTVAMGRVADAYEAAHEEDEPPPLWCQQQA